MEFLRIGTWGSFGFLTLACQVLLFRVYFSAFAGHLLCVGIFFASGCFWIAVGLSRRARPATIPVAQSTRSLLLFVPALWSAYLLTFFVRLLASGESDFLIAANLSFLKNRPDALQRRFLTVEQGAPLFPSGNWDSLYDREQAASRLSRYRALDLPEKRGAFPRQLVLSLPSAHLITADASGLSLLEPLLSGIRQSPTLIFARLLVLLLVRLAYFELTRSAYRRNSLSASTKGFERSLSMASGGILGFATVLMAMLLFQIQFGTLSRDSGLLLSLFGLGLLGGMPGRMDGRFAGLHHLSTTGSADRGCNVGGHGQQ